MAGFLVATAALIGIIVLSLGVLDIIDSRHEEINSYKKKLENNRVKSTLEGQLEKEQFQYTSEYKAFKGKVANINNERVRESVASLLESLKYDTVITEDERESLYKLIEGISFAEETRLPTSEILAGVRQVEEKFLKIKEFKKAEFQSILDSMVEKI